MFYDLNTYIVYVSGIFVLQIFVFFEKCRKPICNEKINCVLSVNIQMLLVLCLPMQITNVTYILFKQNNVGLMEYGK